MPVFTIHTNVAKDKIPSDFVKKTVEIVAQALGKPASYVVVVVVPDQMMSWGGTNDACATVTLASIGQLGVAANKKHSSVLYPHIEKSLGIKGDRMYINYVDMNKADVGYNGTTFDDLL